MIGIISFVLLGIIGPQELIIVFVILPAAILIGNDAKKRGMNAWFWGLFAFFLLIIALPLYFILRKPKDGKLRRFNGGLNERIGRR